MRGLPDELFDLIYLDPPFKSNHDYAAPLGTESTGAEFTDVWTLKDIDVAWWGEIQHDNAGLYEVLKSSGIVGGKSVKAYLIYMAVRILEMHRILKDSGSIYLHCDPTMSHYLKSVLDAVFKRTNFKNEIIWERTRGNKGSQHKPRKLGANHDVILFYAKNSRKSIFNIPKIMIDFSDEEEIRKKFPNIDSNGRRWKDDSSHIFCARSQGDRPNLCYEWRGFKNTHPSGWRLSKERLEEEFQKGNFSIDLVKKQKTVKMANGKTIKKNITERKLTRKIYLDSYKGENMGDIWTDIENVRGNEDLGYPTQKPLELLLRIIKASSNTDHFILDPFCGCATACEAAEKLERSWVGIDKSSKAVDLMKWRMEREIGISKYSGKIIHRTDIPIRVGRRSRDIRCILYGKQEGICNGCKKWTEIRLMDVDHIIPTAKGGMDDDSNLQLLCSSCNRIKGKKTMENLIMRLQELGIREV